LLVNLLAVFYKEIRNFEIVMEMQTILVLVIFILALGYIAKMAYKNLSLKKPCNTGCGKCGVDFSEEKMGKG